MARAQADGGRTATLWAMAGLLALAGPAFSQTSDLHIVAPPPADAPAAAPEEEDPVIVEARRQMAKRRVELERELKKIRATYFRNIRNPEIRQAGIARLRQYNDPAIFPSLLEIFARDGEDVRQAIIDHLASLETEEADITIAWAAVFDDDANIRRDAAARLDRRFEGATPVPRGVKTVVASGLRREDNRTVTAAAHVADILDLAEAIPMLINAQLGGTTVQTGSGNDRTGDLANIVIGQQVAFVSDLRPVVGDAAVAFDPEVSVVTEGVVLRIMDAVVLTYRVDVHNSLVGLSSRLWGQPTGPLGWDLGAWHRWHDDEFLPVLAARKRELAAASGAPAGSPAAIGVAPVPPPATPGPGGG